MSDETNSPDLEVNAAAVSDGAYTLLVADFSETDAWRGRPTRPSSPSRTAARSRSRASSW